MRFISIALLILSTHAAMANGLPYVPDSDDAVLDSAKMVFAHYVWPHPISIDNKSCPNDYYNISYIAYDGEGGAHRYSGGFGAVMIVTWNDQVESSMTAPAQTPYGESVRGLYDLTGYYAQWLRHGVAPTISNDAIFYFHRKMPTQAAATLPAVRFSVSNPTNNIEMLAFLTSDATLQIKINGRVYRRAGKMGLNSFTTPIEPGVPQFSIIRNGVSALELTSDTRIYGAKGLPQLNVPGMRPGIFPAGNVDLTYYSDDTVSRIEAAPFCAFIPSML